MDFFFIWHRSLSHVYGMEWDGMGRDGVSELFEVHSLSLFGFCSFFFSFFFFVLFFSSL